MGERQRIWIEATQKRVDATATMLGSIKAVKMLSLEARLQKALESLRHQEVKISKAYRYLTSSCVVLCKQYPGITELIVFKFLHQHSLCNLDYFSSRSIRRIHRHRRARKFGHLQDVHVVDADQPSGEPARQSLPVLANVPRITRVF